MQNILVVVRNGEAKHRGPGVVLSDGSVRLIMPSGKRIPVVNSDVTARLSLDPKTVSAACAPLEALAKMGDNGNGLYIYTAAEMDALDAQNRADANTTLEIAVPGLAEAIRLSDAAENERERYSREFSSMMEDENNDGARPPRPEDKSIAEKLSAHLASHPRAALYLKARNQELSTHWADNTGKGAAAKRAMEILAADGSIEDATAALAARRECVD